MEGTTDAVAFRKAGVKKKIGFNITDAARKRITEAADTSKELKAKRTQELRGIRTPKSIRNRERLNELFEARTNMLDELHRLHGLLTECSTQREAASARLEELNMAVATQDSERNYKAQKLERLRSKVDALRRGVAVDVSSDEDSDDSL